MKTDRKMHRHPGPTTVPITVQKAGGCAAGWTTPLATNRYWLPILTVLIVLSLHRGVQADEILRPIASFTGNMDSFEFDVPAELAGGNVGDPDVTLTTGPITMSLDPAGGTNLFGLDDVTETGSIDVTLLVDFPLLAALMPPEPPLSIQIIEAGAASVMDCMGGAVCPPNDFTFTATMTGGGMVTAGFFTGTTFSNLNAYLGEGINSSWFPVTPPDITWSLGFSGQVAFPANLGGDVVTGINGNGTLTLVPEPAAVTIFVLGLLGLVGYSRLLRRKIVRQLL